MRTNSCVHTSDDAIFFQALVHNASIKKEQRAPLSSLNGRYKAPPIELEMGSPINLYQLPLEMKKQSKNQALICM